jgi:hypothetical protein
MRIITLVPPDVIQSEIAYVLGARSWIGRLYRAARAAWRCARLARKRA